MIRSFRHDAREWGLSVAAFNLRLNIAWAVSKALIRRPLKLHVYGDE